MHIERASALKRYLSPQLAESILDGKLRKSGVTTEEPHDLLRRGAPGFSAMSESPSQRSWWTCSTSTSTAMTEIVFRHGGTLDKYIGDAIKVFFGDPVQYEDHAARAVDMAIEMQAKLTEMQHRWSVSQDEFLTMDIGISTGYVTVGASALPRARTTRCIKITSTWRCG